MVVRDSGKSKSAFARMIDVGDTTLNNYMTGLTEPGVKELIAICEGTGTLIGWLITGEGPRNMLEVRDSASISYGAEMRRAYSPELVKAVVAAMEEEIQSVGINPAPAKRAELVSAFCLLFKSPDKIEREAMRMMLRATT